MENARAIQYSKPGSLSVIIAASSDTQEELFDDSPIPEVRRGRPMDPNDTFDHAWFVGHEPDCLATSGSDCKKMESHGGPKVEQDMQVFVQALPTKRIITLDIPPLGSVQDILNALSEKEGLPVDLLRIISPDGVEYFGGSTCGIRCQGEEFGPLDLTTVSVKEAGISNKCTLLARLKGL